MAKWLDRLPAQPILDGFEPFNILTSRLSDFPAPLDTLTSFDPRVLFPDEFRYMIKDFIEEYVYAPTSYY